MNTSTNTSLPVDAAIDAIVAALQRHHTVAVSGETGSGKTTRIPEALAERFGCQVIVTEPRVMAAVAAAHYVAGGPARFESQDTVGYRTGQGSSFLPSNKVIYCTDGLQLVIELRSRTRQPKILIIDETHEWNPNQEALAAWARYLQTEGTCDFKLVLMSATLDTEEISRYFGGAPVIQVTGRPYEVTVLDYDGESTLAEVVADLAMEGHNVLAFVEGKAEINAAIRDIKRRVSCDILPLHADLTLEEQQKARRSSGRQRIVVATDVAETSVTVGGITAVVDSGRAKIMRVRNGVEGLVTIDIARDRITQRMGRAGRTEPGVYVLCSKIPFAKRRERSIPAIKRTFIDQLVLRLAIAGLDASTLTFMHQPDHTQFEDAKALLKLLGAIDQDGNVTEMGMAMSRMPVDTRTARMIVRAQEFGVAEPVATIAACMQAKGIRLQSRAIGGTRPGWKDSVDEQASDALAELACFRLAMSAKDKAELDGLSIHSKNFQRAREIRARILEECKLDSTVQTDFDRDEVLRCLLSGMLDSIFMYTLGYDRTYRGMLNGRERQLERDSSVRQADWIIGTAIDIPGKRRDQITGEEYPVTYPLISWASRIEVEWLAAVAPHLVSSEPGGMAFVIAQGAVCHVTRVYFHGQEIGRVHDPVTEASPEATRALAEALARAQESSHAHVESNRAVLARVAQLRMRCGDQIRPSDHAALVELFVNRLGERYRPDELADCDLSLSVSDFVPDNLLENPDKEPTSTLEVDGVTIRVEYVPDGIRWYTAEVYIQEADLGRLMALPNIERARVTRVHVIGPDGKTILSDWNLRLAKISLVELRDKETRAARVAVLENRLAAVRAAMDTLPAHSLSQAVTQAIFAIDDSCWDMGALARADSIITGLEAAVRRLQNEDPEELILRVLLERGDHPDFEHNALVLAELRGLQIRSNGYITPPSDDDMLLHYQVELAGVRTIRDAYDRDLRISRGDYISAEDIRELYAAEMLAPDTVVIQTRKGADRHIPVTYGYSNTEPPVAQGVIMLTAGEYERNSGSLPVLPHDIELIIVITRDGKEVARGTDGPELDAAIRRAAKSRKRGQHVPDTDEFGFRRRAPITGDALPPWFKGRR